jgi:hypothetical protein
VTISEEELERRVRRSELADRAFKVFVAIAAIVIAALVVWLLVSVRNTQIEGTPTGKKLLESSDRILDCTDPGDPANGRPPGKCFSDSQARTAKAVADINRVVIIAAACSAGLPEGLTVDQRQNEIQDCVITRLAQRAAKP